MARVTPAEVKAIIDTDKINLLPFIDAANALVTEVLGETDLSSTLLKEIERWMSAHFIAMSGSDSDAGEVVEEEVGESRVKYTFDRGTGFSNTRYGKQAIMLDTTGRLGSMGKTRASFRVFGYTT